MTEKIRTDQDPGPAQHTTAPAGSVYMNSTGELMQATELYALQVDDVTGKLYKGSSIGTYATPVNAAAPAEGPEAS